ncbi:MAG: transposase [Bacillota bacterium]|nr:transposase [Bacillota bacterium]
MIVGVDVAKYSHWARVIDPRGRELAEPVRFENSRVGFSRLDQVVAEALQGLGLDKVIAGVIQCATLPLTCIKGTARAQSWSAES